MRKRNNRKRSCVSDDKIADGVCEAQSIANVSADTNINDEDILNVRIGFEIVKNEYQYSLNRLNNFDKKYTFLFLIIASIIAALNSIFNFSADMNEITIKIIHIIIIVTIVSLTAAVILMVYGIHPREIMTMSLEDYDNKIFYNKKEYVFLRMKIMTINKMIESVRKIEAKKYKLFLISEVLTIIALVLLGIMLIIVYI